MNARVVPRMTWYQCASTGDLLSTGYGVWETDKALPSEDKKPTQGILTPELTSLLAAATDGGDLREPALESHFSGTQGHQEHR
jgi:hypothetical protein